MARTASAAPTRQRLLSACSICCRNPRRLSGLGARPSATRASASASAASCTTGTRLSSRLPDSAMRDPSRRRVLVTGGAGFLGSHLCEKLLAAGKEVLCVDNFYTGTRGNLRTLLRQDGFELLRHDVTFPLYIEVDEIYNLACPASPVHYQFDPVQTTKTSVHGAINMLGLAKRVKARILQASTSEVYGDPAVHPQKENYWGHVNPVGSRSCYDEGKRCAETLFFDYRRQHGLPIRWRASSTPTGRACIRTTGASCRTSSCRRCAASRSRCTAKAARRARSAT